MIKALFSMMMWASAGLLFVVSVMPSAELACKQWYPYQVELPGAEGDARTEMRLTEYTPLEKARRGWSVCAVFPHMKDSYWLAVNSGLVNEVKRLGVQMRLYEAGGTTTWRCRSNRSKRVPKPVPMGLSSVPSPTMG